MLRFLCLTSIAALVLAQDPTPTKSDLMNKVIGGIVATPNSWPYQVSLRSQSGTCYKHICGGVLIKKQWVLTAAHCVEGGDVDLVVLGEHDQTKSENRKEQYYGVSEIHIHPLWNRYLGNGYDIALIRLTSDAVLNLYVQLATLPPPGQILSTSAICYVTGWGYTHNGGSPSKVLKQAILPVVDYTTCSNSSWWGSSVKNTMICAGGTGTTASCSGDSGGPLSCLAGGSFVVHGLVSFGAYECKTIRKPNVFTRVSAYTTWIKTAEMNA